MPPIAKDPTIYVGLRLFDGFNFDTVVNRVEYGGFGVIAFGPNRLDNDEMTVYKTLRRELLEDPQTRASFVRECLLWMGLWGHPNVAEATALTEMGDAIDQRPFLALAYAERGSLRDLLRAVARNQPGGRLPLDIALHLAQQIAAGLTYLHEPDPAYLRDKPTVHRDLKPENVLLMGGGRAVITDFGLAKAVEESPTAVALLLSYYGAAQPGQRAEEAILVGGEEITRTAALHTAAGVALGTAPYMAPEQWVDARFAGTPADIYALGIMLSEIIAGRHALLDLEQPHTLADWKRAHQDPHPRPLREVVPDVPEVVEALYRRCLARDAEDRPSAAETLALLQAGARMAGQEAYVPRELIAHTPYNELAHWHMWSIAYESFDLYDDALACNDRALPIARQLHAERGDLLPAALLERGTILKKMGLRSRMAGNNAEADEQDRQTEEAYQESLVTHPPATTPEGRRGRASVWHQIGVFNNERQRFAYSDDAYGRALALWPDKANTYFNRAKNQWEWGLTDGRAGHRDSAIAHLRQARIYAATSVGMDYPTANGLLRDIEDVLQKLGAAD